MSAYYKVDVTLNSQAVEVGLPSPQSVNVTIPLVGPAGPAGPKGDKGDPGDIAGSLDWSNVTGKPSTFPPQSHTHVAADVTDFAAAVAAVSPPVDWNSLTGKPSTFAPSAHTHPISDVTNLQTALDGKAASSHTHAISDVTGLQTALDGKAATSHTHADATTSAAGFMSSTDKLKLDGIAAGAEVNVNADWNATSGDAQILNKPTLGTAAASAATDFAASSHTHPSSAISDSTTAGRALLTAADAAAQRSSLGLGTLATINNPLTTAGDLLVGGTAGAPTRLALGTASQQLRVNSGATGLEYFTPSAGGTKTYAVWTAEHNQPPSTSFATLDTRNSIAVLDFDDASTESAVFVGIMPEAASLGSGLIVNIDFMATTATSGNVRWSVAFERCTTDLDSDSFDTATAATVAVASTSGVVAVGSITCTAIDSITAGDLFRLRVQRIGGDGADTMTGDAELIAVEVRSAA